MADVSRRMAHGIRPSQWRLEPEHFEKRVIFLPPLSEQTQLCKLIDVEYRRIEHLIAQVQKLISSRGEYRIAIIAEPAKCEAEYPPEETAMHLLLWSEAPYLVRLKFWGSCFISAAVTGKIDVRGEVA